jgi:hypothetical protein
MLQVFIIKITKTMTLGKTIKLFLVDGTTLKQFEGGEEG